MSEAIEGGCRCGEVRYRLNLERLPRAYACHCLDCQTWSGSAFSLNFPVPEGAVEVTRGEPALFELTHPDGSRTSRQRGCPRCFTRVFNTNTRRPGIAVIRAGSLDRSNELSIAAHMWTRRKLDGIDIPAETVQTPDGPADPAAFFAALMS
ncbi:MAG TPA: GFA family protein [Opitutaceae bacterium]|jgi:hypothetical protein|nr:GFA family protein [Opitutaceae bacterium]